MLAWAVGRIVFSIAMIPLMSDYMKVMMDSVLKTAPGGASAAHATEIGNAVGAASIYGGAVMTSILPIFVLIWFNLGKVRAYMATWQS